MDLQKELLKTLKKVRHRIRIHNIHKNRCFPTNQEELVVASVKFPVTRGNACASMLSLATVA